MARMLGLSGGLPLVYIVYSRKNFYGASFRRPAPLSSVRLLGAGKRVPTMERGTESRTHWLGKAAQQEKPHGGSPAPAIFYKY